MKRKKPSKKKVARAVATVFPQLREVDHALMAVLEEHGVESTLLAIERVLRVSAACCERLDERRRHHGAAERVGAAAADYVGIGEHA